MKRTSSQSFFSFICFIFFSTAAFGQDTAQLVLQWGISAGVNHYTEPGLMQLTGPEMGLHARANHLTQDSHLQLEGDVLLGRQHYSSEKSGSMDGVTNLETRWRALLPVLNDSTTQTGWFSGLAAHTLWNDLRGTSTYNGQSFAGYERIATQLWLPVRWVDQDLWSLEAGLLIYGRHVSKLSQVNTNYSDITNTQRHGQYVQANMSFALDNGETLKPFVRFTHLAESNTVVMANRYWIEPDSKRWQVGVVWEFNQP